MGEGTVPAEAIQVLRAFLEAAERKDEEKMKACLNRRTIESGSFSNSGPEGVRFVLGEAVMEGEVAVIPVNGVPLGAADDSPPAMEMSCLVVKEDGQWKFDLSGTVARMMGGDLGKAVEEMTSAMGQAMEGIGKAISEGLSAAFGSGLSELTPEQAQEEKQWDEASLTPSPEELLPLPELMTLPKTQAALSAAVGSSVRVEAAVTDLLRQLGSDERAGLVDWMDGQLFAGWGQIFGDPALRDSVKDRLRAVRIEAASRCENRILALDGNDLVYRMFLGHTDGYFSDAEIATMLPGVLAGLPEKPDSSVAGYRLLPTDEERPTVDEYRQRWVPRYMRRIRELLAHPVRLEIDWAAAVEATNSGTQLPRWGLNRVYGAIALVCQDSGRRERLQRKLERIRLAVGMEVITPFALYDSGKLEVGVSYLDGQQPGCYEHEIASALSSAASDQG